MMQMICTLVPLKQNGPKERTKNGRPGPPGGWGPEPTQRDIHAQGLETRALHLKAVLWAAVLTSTTHEPGA
jgi:hypothetical protein